MPALGSTATARVRGERNPHVSFTDPLENRAWAVWYAIRNGKARVKGAARKAPGPEQFGLQSESGYVLEINVTTKMKDLWPEFGQLDKTSQAAFASEIRQFLRASGNAACLIAPGLTTRKDNPDHAGQPVWWLRDEWNDARAVGIYRQTELTRGERKLTAAEAGEDRAPAPVEVRQTAPATDTRTLSQKRLDTLREIHERGRVQRAKERVERIDKVLEVLFNASYPLYNTEIAAAMPDDPPFAVEKLLRELIAEGGTVYRRLETREERGQRQGRFHHLYWYEEPVPVRPIEAYQVTKPKIKPEAVAPEAPEQDTPPVPVPTPASGLLEQIEQLVEAEVSRRMAADTGHEETIRDLRLEVANEIDRAEAAERALAESQRQLEQIRSLLGGGAR